MSIDFTNAAKYYKEEPHQVAAWNFLQSKVRPKVIEEFAEMYRSGPETPEPTPAKNTIITPQIMQQLTGYAASAFDDIFCTDFNKLLEVTDFGKYKKEMCMLIGNLMHETGNFKYMKEIADGWAYEGRTDLGNTQPGDGPKFKGTGVLQLTGRYNYTRFSQDIGDPEVVNQGCDYVCDKYPFMSATTWIRDNQLLNICRTKGFDDCCYRINGGWNGYEDRKHHYNVALKVFGVQ